MIMNSYIKKEEYADFILHFIGTEDYNKILHSMSYNSVEFEQGFLQGLVWSGLLMNQCKEFVGETEGE